MIEPVSVVEVYSVTILFFCLVLILLMWRR